MLWACTHHTHGGYLYFTVESTAQDHADEQPGHVIIEVG